MVLPANDIHPWILVNLLVALHFGQEVSTDAQIMPSEVKLQTKFLTPFPVYDSPLCVLLNFFEFKHMYLPCHLFDYIVLATAYIHN